LRLTLAGKGDTVSVSGKERIRSVCLWVQVKR